MKKIIIPIFILILIPILLLLNKQDQTNTQVISYQDEINKINETCHINTSKINIDLNIEYLNSINDNKLIVYANELEELNNYLKKYYYLENKKLYVTLNTEGYVYEIFSIFISKPDDYNHTQLLFKDKEFETHLKYLINESIYEKENIPNNSYIITIQKQIELDKYLIISARRV